MRELRALFAAARPAVAAVSVLLALGLAGCAGDKTEAQAEFDRGGELFAEGDYDGAIAAYERGLGAEPNSAVGLNLLGMAYRMKFNTLRATEWKEKEIAAFSRAVQADSTFWPAHINLGATYYYLGRRPEAAVQFRRALELHPDNPERADLERMIREGGLEPPG